MFADTNSIVRAEFELAPDHEVAKSALETERESGRVIYISRQIVREYLAVLTRPQPWSPPLSMSDALARARSLMNSFTILEDGPEVTETLLELCQQVPAGGRQIHDANIAATMLTHDVRLLLTFNQRDFQRYEPLIELVDTSTA